MDDLANNTHTERDKKLPKIIQKWPEPRVFSNVELIKKVILGMRLFALSPVSRWRFISKDGRSIRLERQPGIKSGWNFHRKQLNTEEGFEDLLNYIIDHDYRQLKVKKTQPLEITCSRGGWRRYVLRFDQF